MRRHATIYTMLITYSVFCPTWPSHHIYTTMTLSNFSCILILLVSRSWSRPVNFIKKYWISTGTVVSLATCTHIFSGDIVAWVTDKYIYIYIYVFINMIVIYVVALLSGNTCLLIIIYLAILHHGMQSFRINRLLHACRFLHDCWRHAHIYDVTHISSCNFNITTRACKLTLMLFNEIDNFINVYNNSVIEPNNSVPKHCIRSITYKYWYLCSIFPNFYNVIKMIPAKKMHLH